MDEAEMIKELQELNAQTQSIFKNLRDHINDMESDVLALVNARIYKIEDGIAERVNKTFEEVA